MGARRGRHALRMVAVVAAVCVVSAVGLLALGAYLAPRVLPNLEARVAAADTVETLRTASASAHVTVPAGWVSSRAWGDGDALVLRSPDGRLSVTMTVVDAPVAGAFTGTARDPAALGAPVTERLASGLEVVHADADEDGLLVAAVGSDGAPSVAVTVRAPTLAPYRAAIAALLESVRVPA